MVFRAAPEPPPFDIAAGVGANRARAWLSGGGGQRPANTENIFCFDELRPLFSARPLTHPQDLDTTHARTPACVR